MKIALLVLILAIIGLVDSAYLTADHYGWVKTETRAITCPISPEGSCETVTRTPEAYVAGIPVSIFGLLYYEAVLIAAIFWFTRGYWPIPRIFALVSVASALISLYLAWLLVFKIRILCPLCFTAHGVNILLAILFSIIAAHAPRHFDNCLPAQ